MIVVGLMSGTSADGIDAAVVDIEGAPPHLDARIRAYVEVPWDAATRERIFELFRPETSSVDRICRMNFHLAEHFAEAALQAIAEAELAPADVHLIGSHGQTIYHDVGEDGSVHSTLQIGEAAVIAHRTGVTTIANFRAADVAAGGQGAPLTSYADALLFRHPSLTRGVQNIGGIANVTFLPPLGDPTPIIAFDTGPGNVLIN
ncbi:MAG: anhydro-N-acetylmuramic acid kinase, partial [Anaerolineae bacterium]